MLEPSPPRRQSGSRSPFRCSPLDEHHPEFLRLEQSLPADNPARLMPLIVSRLDLTALRTSYSGRGSLAFPVEPLLAFVLFMFHCGILSPAAWAGQVASMTAASGSCAACFLPIPSSTPFVIALSLSLTPGTSSSLTGPSSRASLPLVVAASMALSSPPGPRVINS
jgi:hypothetical protein